MNETVPHACMEATDYYEDGQCYRVHYVDDRSKRKSWNDARAQCASLGGDLVGPIGAHLHEKLSERMKFLDERRVRTPGGVGVQGPPDAGPIFVGKVLLDRCPRRCVD